MWNVRSHGITCDQEMIWKAAVCKRSVKRVFETGYKYKKIHQDKSAAYAIVNGH